MAGYKNDKEQASERRFAGGALGFGSSFAVGMALFSLGGHWLDVKYGKEPVFTLLGVFLGLVYGGWELWKLVVETNRAGDAEEAQKKVSSENKGPHESAD